MNRLLAAASLALCLGGIGMVTQGVAVPMQAEAAQRSLHRAFEQRLSANQTPASSGPTFPVRVEPSRDTGRKVSRPRSTRTATRENRNLPTHGPIARLTVDRLGVSDIVLAGEATHDRLSQGPTLLKHGEVTILAAHRDTHFLFIRDLRAGDEVAVQWVTGETARYRITRFETVRWDAFSYPLDPSRPLLALATCYPFGGTEYGGPWRRIAWAELIEDRPRDPMAPAAHTPRQASSPST